MSRYQTVGRGELVLQMKWPPRSPDFTPPNFFLLGYVKDEVFVPPLPLDIYELKLKITATLKNRIMKSMDRAALQTGLCRAMNGSHNEHL
jgi:hypothetical protein